MNGTYSSVTTYLKSLVDRHDSNIRSNDEAIENLRENIDAMTRHREEMVKARAETIAAIELLTGPTPA